MIVTFISECHGRAINETRKVLDAYAHRIGIRTWQTVITVQGLDAVRARLAKKARKNTAVACHHIRGRRHIELLWIVGNRNRFDHSGRVPVHRTQRDLNREENENDWYYLPLMRALVGVAALFHDFGKAWRPFQRFLRSNVKDDSHRDPWRHEWVSSLLFRAATTELPPRSFATLLMELAGSKLIREELSDRWIAEAAQCASQNYRLDCDSFTWQQWVEWLIISHHRLPSRDPAKTQSGPRSTTDIFSQFRVANGYEKLTDTFDRKKHWHFDYGLPSLSEAWYERAKVVGRQLAQWLDMHGDADLYQDAPFVRPLLTLARMSLMIGDHEFSSQGKAAWTVCYQPVANTISRSNLTREQKVNAESLIGQPRQYLDEHLVGVTLKADTIVKLLPAFETELGWIEQSRPLRKPSRGRFAWQNKCVAAIRDWQQSANNHRSGFFGVNMASTGCGKTLANARIMGTLQGDRLRFSLALGLRTLTLQTGHQYREHLKLHESELAVLIGSAAIVELDRQRQETNEKQRDASGAASDEDLAGSLYFAFDDPIPDDEITTVLHSSKARQLLKAPILVCTIDHLIPAIEGTRGNAQPLPLLRLLSCDLIIDEVDDFDACDMPAVARLIHLAGMLGRRVLMSSATVTPSVAEGLFNSYRSGWQHHAAFRHADPGIAAFWADEFTADIQSVPRESDFAAQHRRFVDQRIKRLHQKTDVRQKAIVCPIVEFGEPELGEATRVQHWHRSITDEAIRMHDRYAWPDTGTGKWASIGVVRVANVDPCIDLAEYLLECDVPRDYELRLVCYHARQVLMLRSEIERNLDRLLQRSGNRNPAGDPIVAHHLRRSKVSNVVFVVVATPVAEIGRDHDYDWAIVEPSSMRSIIQMAGRVRRHRDGLSAEDAPNVAILDFNRRFFVSQSKPAYKWPGFEGMERTRAEHILLDYHQLSRLVDMEQFGQRLDATPRVSESESLQPTKHLVDLEHRVLRSVLTDANMGAAFVRGWCESGYWLSDVAQRASRFRQSQGQSEYRLYVDDDGDLIFRKHDPRLWHNGRELPAVADNITSEPLNAFLQNRLWMPLDYTALIDEQVRRQEKSLRRICRDFGELRLDGECGEVQYIWNADLGARRK